MVRRATLGCRSRRDDRWYSDRPIAGGRPAPEVVYIGVRRGGTLASTSASASIRNLRSTSTTIGDYSPCGYRAEVDRSVSFDPSSVEGIEARDTNGFAGGIVGGVLGAPPLPPLPVTPLRVGGVISPPTKLLHVEPIYPLEAAEAHLEGLVILQATIGTGGQITDVEVLRSVPLLDEAAISAVRGWVYTPTLLNGVPVPVVLTVTVNFRLFVPLPKVPKPRG